MFDYNISEGACINGSQEINFNSLPDNYFCNHNSTPISYKNKCGVCNPGNSFIDNKCQSCKYGYFSRGDNSCEKCPINTYSSKSIYLRYFDTFPNFISTSCVNHDMNINACKNFQGWKIFNNSFVTTPSLISQASLILSFDLNVNNKEGKLEFIYETDCTSTSHFYIITNKSRINLPIVLKNQFSISLNSGIQRVSVVFYCDDQFANCSIRIREIKILEIEEGVGTECKKCPLGYFSNEGSLLCLNCPDGRQRRDSDSIACYSCPENYYRDSTMSECQKCPKHTKPNSNRDSCILY